MVITGFMGTGKSTVGRRVAERLGVPFVDTDAMVESWEGRTIAEIFAREGELYFREVERRALAAALEIPRAVVACGGGAVVDPDNRARLRAAGPVVCLQARPDVIARRTARMPGARPLLTRPGAIEELLQSRQAAYADADVQIDTSDLGVEEVAECILRFLETRTADGAGSGR